MRIKGDRPLESEELWSIRSILAMEPYIHMSIEPGKNLPGNTLTLLLNPEVNRATPGFGRGITYISRLERFSDIYAASSGIVSACTRLVACCATGRSRKVHSPARVRDTDISRYPGRELPV